MVDEREATMDLRDEYTGSFQTHGSPVSFVRVADGGVISALTYDDWRQGPGRTLTSGAQDRVNKYPAHPGPNLAFMGPVAGSNHRNIEENGPYDFPGPITPEPNRQYDPGHPVNLVKDEGQAMTSDLHHHHDPLNRPRHPVLSKQAMAYSDQHSLSSPGEDRPNDYVDLAACACLLNFLVGLIAINFSFRSKEAWYAGDKKWAKVHGILAMVLSLLAIGSIVAMAICLLWFYLPRDEPQCVLIFSNGTSVPYNDECPQS